MIPSEYLYVHLMHIQQPEPVDVRVLSGLGASSNRLKSLTTQRGSSINTRYHVAQEFILTARK
jgi:hypothetical protein